MTRLALLGRAGQVVPDHRRPGRGDRAGVRPQRQVPVLLRLDRRRPGARLVRAVQHRHARDAQRLPGGAAQGPAVAAREGERREKESKAPTHKGRRHDDEKPPSRSQGHPDEAAGIASGTRTAAARRTTPRARRPIDAVPDRSRRTSSSASSTCRSRRATSRTCRPATPGRSISSARSDDKTVAAALRPREAQGRDASLPDVADYRVSADGKKLLYRVEATRGSSCRRRRRSSRARARSLTDAIEVKVDPRAEWNADLRRGVAHQPRLLLRPGHARRRLEGRAREVRARSCPT